MKKQTARKLPKKSKYLNIYREIQEKIRNGEYKPGDRIESVRSISERHGFQRGIGLYAMEMLVADGILYSIPKSGFYVNPELDIRRYYTIGYFLNNASPMKSGVSIGGVQKTALRHGYRVIFGMNYQQDCTVTNFMQEHPDLDGIVLDGVLDERTVQAASRFHLPYMVLGNHDISPNHPQKRIPVAERFRKECYHYPNARQTAIYDAVMMLGHCLGNISDIRQFRLNWLALHNYFGASSIYTPQKSGDIDRMIFLNSVSPAGTGGEHPTPKLIRSFMHSKLEGYIFE